MDEYVTVFSYGIYRAPLLIIRQVEAIFMQYLKILTKMFRRHMDAFSGSIYIG